MTGDLLLKCFAVVFLFNTDVICGPVLKELKGNAPLKLLEVLQNDDVGLKRIDSNEAESLIRAIVQTNSDNYNYRQTKSPKQRILPAGYGFLRDEINEGVLTVKDLLAEDLLNDENVEGIIPDNYYELIRDVAKNNDRKFRKILEKSLPLDNEFFFKNKRNIKRIIPPGYEVKGLVPPDYEVRDEKHQPFIPPDFEIARYRIKGAIPPDYELGREKKYDAFIIPPDHEIARVKELKDILPSDLELIVLTNDGDSMSSLEDRLRNEVRKLKKVFVKRLVPTNYESPVVEYDHKLNTYFKPLIRLTKQRSGDEGEQFRNDNEPFMVPFGVKSKKYRIKNDIRPRYRTMTAQEEKKAKNLVKHIQYLVSEVNSPQLKKLTLDRILDVLNQVEGLRQGEDETPSIPPAGNPEIPERQPPALSAYVPFFNYWTYQKTIVDDDCPGDTVKIGNVCSRVPPHR